MKIDDLRQLIDDHFEREEFDKSLQYCNILLQEHSADVTFDDIFKEGLCHYKLDDNSKAIECFDRALAIKPDSILALTNKGICLYCLDRISEAFTIFNQVLKANPNVFPAWYYIGLHYLNKFSQTGDAKAKAVMITAYRQVVRMAPDFGAFPIYDPHKKIDYKLDLFLLMHDDMPDLSIDDITSV